MLRYPELLAWEMLWTNSLRDTYKAIYETAKEANRNVGVGWHVWHNNSFNPIYRAEQDLQAIAPVSDFLKIVIYHNCGGERLATYIDSVSQTLRRRTETGTPRLSLPGPGLKSEKPLADIPKTGLSSEYVLSETKRARAGCRASTPAGYRYRHFPTAASIEKHARGDESRGCGGIQRGRRRSTVVQEILRMKLANLRGAGDAARELRLA